MRWIFGVIVKLEHAFIDSFGLEQPLELAFLGQQILVDNSLPGLRLCQLRINSSLLPFDFILEVSLT